MSRETPVVIVGAGNATPAILSSGPFAIRSILSTQGQATPVILTGAGPGLEIVITNPPALEAETTAWVNQVIVNGGTVSANRQFIVNQFIVAEKATGIWPLVDDYLGLWGENAPQALTSLKQRRLATAVGTPTFVANGGYQFNGTSSYVNSGFIPATHAVAMTPTSVHLEVYERAQVTGGQSFGANSSAAVITRMCAGSGVALMQGRISVNVDVTFPVTGSLGLTSLNRVSAASETGYRNGALVGTSATASTGVTLPTHSLFIGAANAVGVASGFRAAFMGFVAMGASFNATQEGAHYSNLQAMAAAIGAAV